MAYQSRGHFTSQNVHSGPPDRRNGPRSHAPLGRANSTYNRGGAPNGAQSQDGGEFQPFSNSFSGGLQGTFPYHGRQVYESQSYHRGGGSSVWNRPPRLQNQNKGVYQDGGLREDRNDFRESSLRFGNDYSRKFNNPRVVPFIQRKTLLDTFITRDDKYWQNRVTLKMDVPYTDHSHIIGRGGKNTQAVMRETGCHIHFPDSNKNSEFEKSNQVSIAGPMEGVEKARYMIRNFAPLSVTFELKNVRDPSKVQQLIANPALEFDTGTPEITVLVRPNRSSGQPFVLLRGSVYQEDHIRNAYHTLRQMLFDSNVDVPCALSLDIMPDQQQSVLGPNGLNMHAISDYTKCLLHYPPADRKGATTFFIRGSLDGILTARKQILAFLPISVHFELNGEPGMDFAEVEQSDNVRVSYKQKRGNEMIKCVSVKTQEWNATALYRARDQILGMVDKCSPVLCLEYDFMNEFQFPAQYPQSSPGEKLSVAPPMMRLSPVVVTSGFSPGAISPGPTSMLPGYQPSVPHHVSPCNGVVQLPPMMGYQHQVTYAPAPPVFVAPQHPAMDHSSTSSSSLSTSQSEDTTLTEVPADRRRSQVSNSSDVSETPKRSLGSSVSTVRQLSTSEMATAEDTTTGEITQLNAIRNTPETTEAEVDSPIASALRDQLSASQRFLREQHERKMLLHQKPIGSERGKNTSRDVNYYKAMHKGAPLGERFPSDMFCGNLFSQSHSVGETRHMMKGPGMGMSHLSGSHSNLGTLDEVFESEEARDKVGEWPPPRMGPNTRIFGMSAISRPSSLPRGGESLSLEDVQEVDDPLAALLIAHGYARLIPHFQREEIDMSTFLMLTEDDLQDMKLTIGVRRNLLCLIQEKRVEKEK